MHCETGVPQIHFLQLLQHCDDGWGVPQCSMHAYGGVSAALLLS